MRKSIMLAFATLLAAFFTVPSSAEMSTDEFARHLAEKKWVGTQKAARPTPTWQGGILEAKFSMQDGKLTGEFTKATGAPVPAEGTLSLIELSTVKGKPTISFRSRTGTAFQLSLEEDGSLVGDALSGTSKTLVILRPAVE